MRALALVLLTAGCNVQRDSLADSLKEAERIATMQRAALDVDAVRRGQKIFLEGPCVMCHSVRGTIALARVGPDLTHVASRRTLAAGTIMNTRGHLAGWILNPQNLKPGTQMPPTALKGDDLHALVAYMESLK